MVPYASYFRLAKILFDTFSKRPRFLNNIISCPGEDRYMDAHRRIRRWKDKSWL